ncbi:MAG: ABC transporter permease [Firmicutes bacterium]|nr:ABC transporter permease [Bacillota bacterium]
MTALIQWINSAVVYGTVIMYAAMGEILTEKSGHLNLGVPGLMFLGGFAGFGSAYIYENSTDSPSGVLLILLPLLAAFAASCLGGLLYSFLTVTLRANQNVTGLALTSFGVGVGTFGGVYLCKISGNSSYAVAKLSSAAFTKNLNAAFGLGTVGQIFLSYGFLAYTAILLAVLLHFVLSKTRVGLNLRAVGENPGTADAAGINVTLYKYLATCLGGGICGIGGLYYVLEYCLGGWSTNNSIESLGWLAVALVIFSTWRPLNAIWGSYLFALLFWLYNYFPTLVNTTINAPITDLLQMIPYVVTIIVLIVVSIHRKKENQGPASLGLSYFREER